ncbi:AAA family ATPase [Terrilactibacillus sp. BCM23-1]|uniref:Nuclease SbcCD subunit C n=1 Tax=Terrilactibacillus tamarindi TaxID=2599694 RepID=A0A6N8CNV4_9BACI|nr:AAA family ATPase [Terrilactibacillus tamarindi]MTT30535.1 AAA family ATPase [Terrilactibacillus tamarindi]
MKPKQLMLRGLNSFREEQTIDFDMLCADGIFGIFGPTGSGKSSLLDAITLALYGKVERAAKNTQGILNHAEDKLQVGFTFEMGGANPTIYRVERMYKRTKDNGLKIGSCRLLKYGESAEVLADKERDVTQGIQDILGLTHDDFTRAVVLPQGKFAEFLSLKGAERRKMLQRLFHLERYGDEMIEKLKKRLTAFDQRLSEIVAEEQGLGDASKETLVKLQKEYNLLTKQVDESNRKNKDTETKLEELKKLWQLQKDWNQNYHELEEMIRQDTEMQALKLQVKQAEQAIQMMPIYEAWRESEASVKEVKETVKEQERLFHHIQQEENRIIQLLETAKQKQVDQEPILQQKKTIAEEGLNILEKLQEMKPELAIKQTAVNELMINIKQKKRVLDEELSQHEALISKRKELQHILNENKIDHSYRTIIQQALSEKKDIQYLNEKLEGLRQEWVQQHRQCVKSEDILKNGHSKSNQLKEKARRLFSSQEVLYHKVVKSEQQAVKLQDFMSNRLNEERLHLMEAYKQKASLNLVHDLQEGSACPVCGSTHHPNPAKKTKIESEDIIVSKINRYEKFLDNLAKSSNRLENYKIQCESHAANLMMILDENEVPMMSKYDKEENDPQQLMDSNSIEKLMEQHILDVKAYYQDLIELKEQIEKVIESKKKNDVEQSKGHSEFEFYLNKQKELEEKAAQIKQEIEEKKKSWSPSYPPLEEIEEKEESIKRADQKVEKYEEQLNHVFTKQDEIEEKIKKLSEEVHQDEQKEASYKAQLDSLTKTQQDLIQSLSKLNFDENTDLHAYLQNILQKMETLLSDRTKFEELLKKTQEDRFEKEKTKEKGLTRLAQIELQEQKTKERWDEVYQLSIFNTLDAFLNAYAEEAKVKAWVQKLEVYERRKEKLTSDLQDIEKKLSGRQVTEEAVVKLESQAEALKERYHTLLEERAACGKEKNIIEKNHQRFVTLEEEKHSCEKEITKLKTLQQIFRGNGFVEFVAEEQLHQVCIAASRRLGDLTHGRYALEVDTAGGFIIRDDANGGIRRPVSTLSGGETFLTSLALALSLSEQIQLTGDVPLQFFFLDEGFGTLDPELLDTVVTSLEKLHMNRLSIGVISHVPELRARLPRKLIVEPAKPSGEGSTVHLELL